MSLACTNISKVQHAQSTARTLRFFGGEANADVATINGDAVGTVHGILRKRNLINY